MQKMQQRSRSIILAECQRLRSKMQIRVYIPANPSASSSHPLSFHATSEPQPNSLPRTFNIVHQLPKVLIVEAFTDLVLNSFRPLFVALRRILGEMLFCRLRWWFRRPKIVIFSHEIVDAVEKGVVADVHEWTGGSRWLFLGLLLCSGSFRGLYHGLGHSVVTDLSRGECLPLLGYVHGRVGQGPLARVDG